MEVIGKALDVMTLVVAIGEVTIIELSALAGGDDGVRARVWMTVLMHIVGCCL